MFFSHWFPTPTATQGPTHPFSFLTLQVIFGFFFRYNFNILDSPQKHLFLAWLPFVFPCSYHHLISIFLFFPSAFWETFSSLYSILLIRFSTLSSLFNTASNVYFNFAIVFFVSHGSHFVFILFYCLFISASCIWLSAPLSCSFVVEELLWVSL